MLINQNDSSWSTLIISGCFQLTWTWATLVLVASRWRQVQAPTTSTVITTSSIPQLQHIHSPPKLHTSSLSKIRLQDLELTHGTPGVQAPHSPWPSRDETTTTTTTTRHRPSKCYVRTYVRARGISIEASDRWSQKNKSPWIISLKNSDQSLAILLRAHYNL